MKKLLIVEDDQAQLRALNDKFSLEGFTVITATNGADALHIALEQKPEAILLDLNMPKMDGLEFLESLRADEWGKDAKVVVFTNRDDSDAVAECMKFGVFQVFLKSNESLDGIVGEVKEFIG